MFVEDFIGFDQDFASVLDLDGFGISDIISNIGIGLRSKVSNNISLEYLLELSRSKFKYYDFPDEHIYNVIMPEISIYLIIG